MKRRNFVHNASIGFVGFNLANADIRSIFENDKIKLWLREYVMATHVNRVTVDPQLSESLNEEINKVDLSFLKTGFKSTGDPVYFYPHDDRYCFCSSTLRHDRSGMTDILLPFFHKDASGTWHHFTTINGYQLEALVHAARTLTDCPYPLEQLLLPIQNNSSHQHFPGFYTQKGTLEISTVIDGQKQTETSILISTHQGVIMNETFASEHCLTCSLIVA